MANGIDKKINDLATAWQGYKGTRIEEFLKEYLSKLDGAKFGFVNIESGENSLQTIRFFRDEQAYADWFADRTANADRVLGEFSLYSNKPVESYTMRAIITHYPAANMARGAQNAVSLAYNCYWGDNPADRDTQDGTATVEVNGVAAPALTRQLKASGTATANVYTFELGDLLTAETNEVKLRVTNAHGAEKVFTFNINTYSLTLEFDPAYDESQVQTSRWSLRVLCQGVPATVYCRIQDGGRTDTLTKSIHNSSGEAAARTPSRCGPRIRNWACARPTSPPPILRPLPVLVAWLHFVSARASPPRRASSAWQGCHTTSTCPMRMQVRPYR